ncbi:hypothetical protein FOA52_012662 [Chlamydomonas sp. UWO 241]|nr:hypothetical protein FOA52_012662 [Chlamydomonas sp. UWO 241]
MHGVLSEIGWTDNTAVPFSQISSSGSSSTWKVPVTDAGGGAQSFGIYLQGVGNANGSCTYPALNSVVCSKP